MTTTGDKPTHLWVFDRNRRVYGPDRNAPIWREHWVRHEIIGETSRSWIISRNRKISKTAKSHLVAYSEEELDLLGWVHDHRCKIIRAVEYTKDAALLAKIAQLINYPHPAPLT